MYEQKVKAPAMSGLKGLLLVLAVMAALLLGSALFTLLGRTVGNVASLMFIAYACFVAWFLLSYYIMGFVYVTDGSCLRISRTYGKRPRFACDVWLNTVLSYGDPEEVQKRYPGLRTERFVKKQCALAPFAIVCQDSKGQRMIVIQPDDRLRAELIAGIKK